MRREPLLRRKLLTWLLIPLSLLLIADMFISYWVALSFSQRAYDRTLLEIAREVSLRIGGAKGRLEFDLPEAVREVLFTDPRDTLYYEVSAVDGSVIAGDPIGAREPHHGKSQRELYYDGTVRDAPVRIVELYVGADPTSGRPPAVVRVAETKLKRDELTREILLSVLLPQVALILLAGAIVWAGVVHGLAPLDKVRRAVALRSHRERGPVPVSDVPGEVRPLVDAVNGLLERLDHVLTLQARFVADAAHQLKTPVAGLQAQVELTLREPDPERIRESIRRLYPGLERLARLVSQLLSLARNEPDAVRSVILEPLDLNTLALETAKSWVPEALGKYIDLGLESSDSPVMIRGEPARLRELFDNLLDNAVRYTPHGGRVTVRVTGQPVPSVTVSDDGPAIPPHERTRVFERFHRLLGTSRDGSGLGLAIALEIARLHDAQIVLEDDKDGIGNSFTVSFPPSVESQLSET